MLGNPATQSRPSANGPATWQPTWLWSLAAHRPPDQSTMRRSGHPTAPRKRPVAEQGRCASRHPPPRRTPPRACPAQQAKHASCERARQAQIQAVDAAWAYGLSERWPERERESSNRAGIASTESQAKHESAVRRAPREHRPLRHHRGTTEELLELRERLEGVARLHQVGEDVRYGLNELGCAGALRAGIAAAPLRARSGERGVSTSTEWSLSRDGACKLCCKATSGPKSHKSAARALT